MNRRDAKIEALERAEAELRWLADEVALIEGAPDVAAALRVEANRMSDRRTRLRTATSAREGR